MSRLDEECIMAVVRNRSGIDSGEIDYSIFVSRFENMSIVDLEDALKTLMVLEQRCRERILELMSEREQKLQSENEKLKETIEELKKPLIEQMFYARKKLENSDKPNTFVAIDALLNELDAISENEKLKEREKFLNEKLQIAIKQRDNYIFMLGECSEINVIAQSNQCKQEIEEVGK